MFSVGREEAGSIGDDWIEVVLLVLVCAESVPCLQVGFLFSVSFSFDVGFGFCLEEADLLNERCPDFCILAPCTVCSSLEIEVFLKE